MTGHGIWGHIPSICGHMTVYDGICQGVRIPDGPGRDRDGHGHGHADGHGGPAPATPRDSPRRSGGRTHSASGILTTWYKRVHTCFKHVCTRYVQCLSTAADRHGIYKNENSCTCSKHVHTYLQIHVHVCTQYVHSMYKGTYKRVCASFKHVYTRL